MTHPVKALFAGWLLVVIGLLYLVGFMLFNAQENNFRSRCFKVCGATKVVDATKAFCVCKP